MRLSFANGEHADFLMDSGVIGLGSAHGNALVLNARDVAAWHARITLDPRGAVLEILDSGAQTHLNARPVREKALLRCGDVLCLGRVAITLKADRDDLVETDIPAEPLTTSGPALPPRAVLRGVSGSHFGKAVVVSRRLVIGRGAGCDLVIDEACVAPRHTQIESGDNLICMREFDGSGGARVNGIPTRNAILHPGDQLTFGRSQFVVEAPGYPMRGEAASGERAITEPTEALSSGDEGAAHQGQGGIWWLIGAAALIALSFALLINHGV